MKVDGGGGQSQNPEAENRLHLAEEMENRGLERNLGNAVGVLAVTDPTFFQLDLMFVLIFVGEFGERSGREGV